MRCRDVVFLSMLAPLACGDDPPASESADATSLTSAGSESGEPTTSGTNTTTVSTTLADTSAGPSTSVDSSSSDDGPKFDLGRPMEDIDTGDPGDLCHVQGDNAVGDCKMEAPADSFVPEVQWSWAGYPGEPDCIVTPLVANLTDDNNDGEINLCDIPDILIVGSPDWYVHGHMALIDGATGTPHFQFAELSQWAVTPAIGDIDDDGIPEIVGSVMNGGTANLAAWEHDGTLKWTSTVTIPGEYSIALADIDTDGDVEIVVGASVTDHNGNLMFNVPDTPTGWAATTLADLDEDGSLEIVMGRSAYHNDGTQYFLNNGAPVGMPQVANLDADDNAEVLILPGGGVGMTVLEHDGTTKYTAVNPTGDGDWRRPAAIHDLDGDDVSEIAVSSTANYGVYEGIDASVVWVSPVLDSSGLASGTAFDFLGDGIAEAIYADETNLFVFGDDGAVLLQTPRSSGTLIEYPVVADVDNDGSSEIIVVSNETFGNQTPLLQVIRDEDDRWIQSRRIWNQHTYHVTNVREDGTIPQNEQRHWHQLNTFRTNAQIEGGGICDPRPPG
ncbi:MAG TPA: VCBS repeat-containing protein [Nannocystaceae bacterium]|nr:VCBS repeat-containing protein [Nannocystaceae bacterium]